MIKKVMLLLLMGVLVLAVCACEGSENETVTIKPRVIMVSDTAGLGDQGLNDLVWAGCEKASREEDVDIRCLESESKKDYERNIKTAVQEDAAVIVCAGAGLTDATRAMAMEYPDARFILVGGAPDVDESEDEEESKPENVTCLYFHEEEAAFLAGVAAAGTSTTGKVGFIGGVKTPARERYQYGFIAGVETVNPEAEVFVDYTGNFNVEEDGKTLARKQREAGVDVIFHSAGKGGIGVIDLAGVDDFWVIGSERDQSGLDSEHVLCSVIKNGDAAVYEEIKKGLKDKLTGGTVSYNLKDEGVSLSDNAGNLNADLKEEIDRWRGAIIKGNVIVPVDAETAAEYIIPEL